MVPEQGAHEERGLGGKEPREALRNGRHGNRRLAHPARFASWASHSAAPALNRACVSPKGGSGHVPLPALRRRE